MMVKGTIKRYVSKRFGHWAAPWTKPHIMGLVERVRPYTMSDPARLAMLYGLVEELNSTGIQGDIVECGVCQGGSSAMMAFAAREFPARKMWLYDTFEGIPPATEKDGAYATEFTGAWKGSDQDAKEALAVAGFPDDRVVLRKGVFAETFKADLPGPISLLHIDADWHDSVLLALETLYSHVVPGGYVVLDDFGYWEGCRRAFYEFCGSRHIEPVLERNGASQAFWRVGREHSRDDPRYNHGIYAPSAWT